MPEHLEAGTLNVHGIAGLGGALNYLSEIGTEAIIKKERSLIKRLEDQIRDLQNIHLYGNPDSSQRVGILSFNMGDEDSAYVADWLFEEEEIAVVHRSCTRHWAQKCREQLEYLCLIKIQRKKLTEQQKLLKSCRSCLSNGRVNLI